MGPIGSRGAYFQAYLTKQGLRFRAGCFFGDLACFRAKLARTHENNEHAQEYLAALQFVFRHAELWTPKEEAEAPEQPAQESPP
jgi:hypothetical protein